MTPESLTFNIPSGTFFYEQTGLSKNTPYFGDIVAGVLEPYFMSPTVSNARGKTVIICGLKLNATWACFRLPETKDRTFGEMDIMF